LTRISESFAELNERGEGALIAYLTVGYPNLKATPRLVGALIEGGADIIELGIPFSDPIADGPTIQSATTQSLKNGVRPLDTLDMARDVHEKHDTPLVLMSYFNPIYRLGLHKFLALAKNSGISGIIVPDLPLEESKDYKKESVSANIDTIFLASPSTQPDRLRAILAQTSGYLYLVSLYGVTGIRSSVAESTLTLIGKYRATMAGSLPLAVGFGISTPNHVKEMIHAGADGAIVGSAFVDIIRKNQTNPIQTARILEKTARAMKKATARPK
jgi:tryptophan synthase alpha chain